MKNLFVTFTILLLFFTFSNESTNAANLEYKYDANNRLKEIIENNETVIRFEYDFNGNLLSQSIIPLLTPNNLKVLKVNDTTVDFSWDKVLGAAGYDIFIDNSYSFSTFENSASMTALEPNTTYNVKVKAKNSFTQGDFGEEVSYKTASMAPNDLQVSNIQETSITLSWSPSEGAKEYQVFFAHPNGTVPLYSGKTTNSTFTVNNLKHGTGYKFLVKTVTDYGISSFSEPITSYTAMNAPFLDNNEPNDNLEIATLTNRDLTYTSYISSKNDIDYYKTGSLLDYHILDVQIEATNRNYILELYKDGFIYGTTKSNTIGGISLPVSSRSNITFKVVGDYSYSTKESYKIKYTLISQGTTTPTCPPRMICQDPPPVEVASLKMKSMDLYENEKTSDINIVTDIYSSDYETRLLAYRYISETGVPEDIEALKFMKENSHVGEEKDIIEWTIAKIAYNHFKEQPNTILRYLDFLVLKEDIEIQAWLIPILDELFGDESAVRAYLDSFS